MSLRTLETVADVVDALGGPTKAAKLAGKKFAQSMSNAVAAKRLPADCYLIMIRELERLGYVASPALWGITPPHAVSPSAEPCGASS